MLTTLFMGLIKFRILSFRITQKASSNLIFCKAGQTEFDRERNSCSCKKVKAKNIINVG
jgi:hypothetical protein